MINWRFFIAWLSAVSVVEAIGIAESNMAAGEPRIKSVNRAVIGWQRQAYLGRLLRQGRIYVELNHISSAGQSLPFSYQIR